MELTEAPAKVSAIMVFLDAEKFIREAIESVLFQTYDHWELLLVDDGSRDQSRDIALEYANAYKGQISYLEHAGHQNRGMSASRNLGISFSTGKYLAFLDSDDTWLSTRLARHVEILEAHPEAAMVYGPTQWWFSWTDGPSRTSRDSYDFTKGFGFPLNNVIEPPNLLTLSMNCGAAVPCICSILVRAKAVENIAGFEEQFQGAYEDQAFYSKLYLHSAVYVSSECLARYRQHPDSYSARLRLAGKQPNAHELYLRWLGNYLEKNGAKKGPIDRAWSTAMWPYRHRTLSKLFPPRLRRFWAAVMSPNIVVD
jgi:glycosyltransferase involved in cell wall biosynthesis